MDSLYLLLLLIFVGLPIGIGLLLYFVPKKMGHPKAAKYITSTYAGLVALFVLAVAFEDFAFTKSDARGLVEEQEIVLADDFKLVDNRSMSAMSDYYHTFTLALTERDRRAAIRQIKNSVGFKSVGAPTADSLRSKNRYSGPRVVQNYETENAFVREYFQPSGREGYAPTFRRISVRKASSQLVFEDINE